MRDSRSRFGWATEARNRRRALSMADQAASSLSNVLVALLVAHSFDTTEPFGAFGLAMVAYQMVLGVNRSVVGEPFLSLYSDASAEKRMRLLPDLLATAALVALSGAVCLAAIGLTIGGLSGQALVALAVVLPLVLLQDTWRFFFIVDRAAVSLVSDLAWLLAVVGAFWVAPSDAGIGWYVIAWGLGGALGAVVPAVLTSGTMGRPHPWRWLTEHKALCGSLFGEFLTSNAVSQIVMTSLAPIGGLKTLAAARASQTYYGPHFTLYGGAFLAFVPEGARNRKQPKRLWRMFVVTSIGLSVLAGVWMLIGLAVPTSWGEALLNANWAGARDLMVPFGVGMMATGVACGPRLGLRSLGDARRIFTTRMRITPWQAVCPLAGAFLGGAVGFAVGFAVSKIATAIIYWRSFAESLRTIEPDTPESVGEEPVVGLSAP